MKANVLNYLEASVEAGPERCAVIDENGSYSYEALAETSMRIGSALARIGVQGRGVVVVMDKGFDALAVQLGVLYAGGFYAPVDPAIPASRLESIISALGDPPIVHDGTMPKHTLSACSQRNFIACTALKQSSIDYDTLAAIRANTLETDPVYALFTSGSTGEPKGVVISHRAIVTFIDSFVETFEITSEDRIGNQAPFGFDVSTKVSTRRLRLRPHLCSCRGRCSCNPLSLSTISRSTT